MSLYITYYILRLDAADFTKYGIRSGNCVGGVCGKCTVEWVWNVGWFSEEWKIVARRLMVSLSMGLGIMTMKTKI